MGSLSLYNIKNMLKPNRNIVSPADDFRIIDSWVEYGESGHQNIEDRPLKYMCYEIEVVNPETGDKTHCYKAVKFARVVRIPKSAKQSTRLMDMHQQILAAVYENEINLITVIANIIHPVPLGLLFLYGVQGVAENIEDAKEKADGDFRGLIATLQGTYRVLELKNTTAQEIEWLREKLYGMEYITAVRGIPKAAKTGEDAGNRGIGGNNLNPDSEGTLEELIAGMADYEYVIESLSTPVPRSILERYQVRTETFMTDWYGQMQGQKSISFNISVPMMYGANTSSSQGTSHAYTEADSLNFSTGENFSTSVGESVGESLSNTFGQSYGQTHGTSVTDSISNSVSQSHSISSGQTIGETIGHSIGSSFGTNTGVSSGGTVGTSTGTSSGISTGSNQGSSINSGVSHNTNSSYGVSSNDGTSMGHSIGQSLNTSQGVNNSTSVGQNESISANQSHSVNTSDGTNQSTSYNTTQGHTEGLSHNQGLSHTEGYGTSQNVSQGTTQNVSDTTGSSFGKTMGNTASYSHTEGSSENWGDSHSHSSGTNVGINNGTSATLNRSDGKSSSWNVGGNVVIGNVGHTGTTNDTLSVGTSENSGFNVGTSAGYNEGTTHSAGASESNAYSFGENNSVNSSVTNSHGVSNGISNTQSQGWSQNASTGTTESYGTSASDSLSQSYGASAGTSHSTSIGDSASSGWSQGNSLSQTSGTSASVSQGQNVGDNWGTNHSTGTNQSVSAGSGTSDSVGQTFGTSFGQNSGTNQSTSTSQNIGQSSGRSEGINSSDSYSQSISKNYSESSGTSVGQTIGKSVGSSDSTSYTESNSVSQGTNHSTSTSNSTGQSYSTSSGKSISNSAGSSSTVAQGMSSSMGLGPSMGYSKSYQWLDQQVKDIIEMLEYDNNRYKRALRGEGAFYTYMYIACPSMDALNAAKAVAKSAWQNEDALTHPLQILNLNEDEQKHLLYHFCAFSSDITKEDVYGISDYRYCTVLLPYEYIAYTHLPRISEGGIYAEVNDIPKFTVPGMMKGEIYMGTILSPERFTFNNGYNTQFDYRLDESELMHGFFTGASRSGKTVAAMRFVAELSQVKRKATGKRLRIVCLDPKRDWRGLARYVEPERFRFYSLGNVNFRPIKLNPWKIPYGVWPQTWIDGVIDIYCRAYGLLERGKQMIGEIIYKLYDDAGVFEACNKEDWREKVPELSKVVTFEKIYKKMDEKRMALSDASCKTKVGHDTMDAYARLLDRLQAFDRDYSIEHQLFGTEEGMGIDEMIGDDDVTVLESKGLENTFKNFIFGVITSGFYKYALGYEKGYLSEDQYETVIVIEEANEVLTGNDCASSKGGSDMCLAGQSEFEQILDQAAGYGLYIIAITQKISMMPSSILANSGLKFIGKISVEEDVNVAVRQIGREERIEDRDVVKWLPKSPTGWFIIYSSRGTDYKKIEPVLVKIAMLNLSTPTNAEIDEILIHKDAVATIRRIEKQQAAG